jgi:hypothetical protein
MGKAPVEPDGHGTKKELPANGGWGSDAKAQRGQPQPKKLDHRWRMTRIEKKGLSSQSRQVAKTPRRKKLFASLQCYSQELRIFGKVFLALRFLRLLLLDSFCCGFAALCPCAFALDSSSGLRIGPHRAGGGFNGGGIRHPGSNHSILYPLSIFYDPFAARVPLSASFDHF